MTTYTATSAHDVVQLFLARAAAAREASRKAITRGDRRVREEEVRVWNEAADILANTRIAADEAPPPDLQMGTSMDDEGRQIPALGFEHQGTFITDPRTSECGRFPVDPKAYYGLTDEQIARLDAAKAES